jgi:phosphate transport system permease protein
MTTASVAPGRSSPLGQVRSTIGDRAFRVLVVAAAYVVLAILAGIAIFLVLKAVPALHKDTANFFTTFTWDPDDTRKFGIGVLAYGTLVTALLALVIAVPVAVGVALFIAYYAPRRLAQPLGYLIDLLAAVPSIVYGLWGLLFLKVYSSHLQLWVTRYFSWTHVLGTSTGTVGQSFFLAGTVLAVMILPIVAAISREIFLQVPQTQREAALALGATKWEMIKWSAIPYARSGIASAAVLGFGRALGETIAVAIVLSTNYDLVTKLLSPGGNTIAANIANTYGDAGKIGTGALIASGLVLFVITLVVNLIARAIARQSTPAGGVV